MASTSAELIVAKAALTGALFRADPQSCSRDEIESTLALLNTATAECSLSNVQKCKQWALANLVPSSMRIAPFCKYLVALVNSYGKSPAKDLTESEKKRGRETSVKRKRLHALYLLNDILYHVKFRNHDDSFAPKLEQALPALVRSASSFTNCPKHIRKIQDLISLWEEKGYFSEAVIKQLRVAVEEAPASVLLRRSTTQPTVTTTTSSVPKPVKAAPFIMPAMHGDPSIPWYDLPAGNWMPVLEPNSTRPMNPDMIKPLVLYAGPAEKSLVEAVKKLLVDVDNIFSKDAANLDGPTPEIGQMGEVIETDEITGEVIGGETYYGWSRNFCEKMKKRNQRGASGNDSRSRTRERTRSSRSRSRSFSPSRSRDSSRGSDARPAFKRPRLSESPEGRYRKRSRSRSQDRSVSRSRSRDRSRRGRGYDSRSRSRSRSRGRYRSRSRSRSTSRPGFRQRSPTYGSRGRSRSRSPGIIGLRGGQHQPPYHAPLSATSFPTGMPPRPPQHPGVFVPPPPPPPNQQPAGNFHPVPPPIGFPVPVPSLPGQPHQFPGFPVPHPPQTYQGGQWPPPPPGPPHQYPQHPQHPTPPSHITTPSPPPPNFFPPGGPMGVSPHHPPPFAAPPGGAWSPPPPQHANQPPHHHAQQHQQHQPQYHHQSQQHQGRDYQGYSQHQPRDYQQQGREGEYGGGNGSGYRGGGRGGGGAGRGDYGRGGGGYGGQRGGAPRSGGWA
ncbi:unnamed protein product [Sordaria macrospora k-hell]|uniref:WGS project CABT00000000 data, contig 2.11 n=1 Tax=Sordaria macrospora (strain ATCC MYA-333 / DSM 997 / K(L3346) / K-hell) TaxID=771870 RepID=F7VX15_SORMK|nr:uncharacterized protein SMAC_02635 [Sordaria macrospora k-hell]CCC10056.1 unnamed protein product [Sordaria macrospora k-hell]